MAIKPPTRWKMYENTEPVSFVSWDPLCGNVGALSFPLRQISITHVSPFGQISIAHLLVYTFLRFSDFFFAFFILSLQTACMSTNTRKKVHHII
jgi:hypothetical protein